jgi:hypothetical protein
MQKRLDRLLVPQRRFSLGVEVISQSRDNMSCLGSSDRLCGLDITVPGYTTEMHCASCEVRTEFKYVM